jgi:hypothetical protein
VPCAGFETARAHLRFVSRRGWRPARTSALRHPALELAARAHICARHPASELAVRAHICASCPAVAGRPRAHLRSASCFRAGRPRAHLRFDIPFRSWRPARTSALGIPLWSWRPAHICARHPASELAVRAHICARAPMRAHGRSRARRQLKSPASGTASPPAGAASFDEAAFTTAMLAVQSDTRRRGCTPRLRDFSRAG